MKLKGTITTRFCEPEEKYAGTITFLNSDRNWFISFGWSAKFGFSLDGQFSHNFNIEFGDPPVVIKINQIVELDVKTSAQRILYGVLLLVIEDGLEKAFLLHPRYRFEGGFEVDTDGLPAEITEEKFLNELLVLIGKNNNHNFCCDDEEILDF